jgi:hypothetical protein
MFKHGWEKESLSPPGDSTVKGLIERLCPK